jgi:hypothetical protein
MGVIACIAVVGGLGVMGYVFIEEKVSEWKRAYKIKHRFDKPPIAKCYCRDCKYYSKTNNDCWTHTGWKVADNWFCWSATPNNTSKDVLGNE